MCIALLRVGQRSVHGDATGLEPVRSVKPPGILVRGHDLQPADVGPPLGEPGFRGFQQLRSDSATAMRRFDPDVRQQPARDVEVERPGFDRERDEPDDVVVRAGHEQAVGRLMGGQNLTYRRAIRFDPDGRLVRPLFRGEPEPALDDGFDVGRRRRFNGWLWVLGHRRGRSPPAGYRPSVASTRRRRRY